MDDRPPWEQDTLELVDRFRASRARHRRLRIAGVTLAAVIVLGGVAAAVVFAWPGGPRDPGTPASDVTGLSEPDPDGIDGATHSSDTTTTARAATAGPPATHRATSSTRPPPGETTPDTQQAVYSEGQDPFQGGSGTTGGSGAGKTLSEGNGVAALTTGMVVVIDPGHQARGDSTTEPVGPGASEKKPKVSSGTRGVATGTPESELVLTVGLKLRTALEAYGVRVVMTRTTQDVNISNIARTQMANEAGANLYVRIHADGANDPSTAGIHVLYPAVTKGWTDDIAAASKEAAAIAQRHLIAATGAKDRGIDARSDMTGFNWSDVPVILPEIGFMTNAAEDRRLASAEYQDKIVSGLTAAILEFLGTD